MLILVIKLLIWSFLFKLHTFSVGDHRPVGRDRIRSRPKNSKIGRDPKIQKSVATQTKKTGHDRPRVATQNKNPVATDHGSRPRKNIRSRPTTGRGPKKKFRSRPVVGRDRNSRPKRPEIIFLKKVNLVERCFILW
jgi:hypothetical protein